jgi:Kef-type K+ transport system membrane component KefB
VTTDFFFLPDWPLDLAQFPWVALLLLAALGAGEVFDRFLRLPKLLGWIAAGVLFGPHALGFFNAELLARSQGIVDVAIGLLLFELGQRVDLSWLRRNPWLLGTSVLEAGLSFGAIFALLGFAGFSWLLAAVAAAIGMATSPAVVMVMTKELRAQGQVTERVLLLTTLNCIYAVVATSMLFAWLHAEYRGGWVTVLSHPLYLVFGSLALAAVFTGLTHGVLRLLGRRVDAQFVSVLAFVVIAVAVAELAQVSVVLTLLAFGMMTRHFDRQRRFVSLEFGRLGMIFMILLFALVAAEIELALVPAGLLAGAGLIAARWLGKTVGVLAFARWSGLGLRKSALVGVGLMPMSALAVLLVQETARMYPEFGPQVRTVVVSAVAILEILGPLLLQLALRRAGESNGSK